MPKFTSKFLVMDVKMKGKVSLKFSSLGFNQGNENQMLVESIHPPVLLEKLKKKKKKEIQCKVVNDCALTVKS